MNEANQLMEYVEEIGISCDLLSEQRDDFQQAKTKTGKCVGYTIRIKGMDDDNSHQILGDLKPAMLNIGFCPFYILRSVANMNVVLIRSGALSDCDESWQHCMGLLQVSPDFLKQNLSAQLAYDMLTDYLPYWLDMTGKTDSVEVFGIDQLEVLCQDVRDIVRGVRDGATPTPAEQIAWLQFDDHLSLLAKR